MRIFQRILQALCILVTLNMSLLQANTSPLKPFISGSYQEILAKLSGQPFMLVVWSTECSSCLKDMALLSKIHQKTPDLRIVMLATDGQTANNQIDKILKDNQLSEIDNWNYADDNSQKLQYEIDPDWFGELPRTYFFDKAHAREGISGVLTEEKYQDYFTKILK